MISDNSLNKYLGFKYIDSGISTDMTREHK